MPKEYNIISKQNNSKKLFLNNRLPSDLKELTVTFFSEDTEIEQKSQNRIRQRSYLLYLILCYFSRVAEA